MESISMGLFNQDR